MLDLSGKPCNNVCMENPNCPRCKGEEFTDSVIKYELAGKDSKDVLSVIVCKNCGAIIGTPTRHIIDNFLQIGYKLEEISAAVSKG